jgi:uncharacterized protein (TIGR00730 family)
MTGRAIKTIAVYCGSNTGQGDVYLRAADALGRHLAKSGIGIVYGGTHKGLMGALADAAIAEGGMVHGVITERLRDKGHLHERLSRHEILPTMKERKHRMMELADAFIALPGGIGTLEEFMEVWTLNQLGELPEIAWIRLSSVTSSEVNSRMIRPLIHRHDAVGDVQHLGHFRADHDHGIALRRKLADQVVDLGLGADVDAAGRFVHDQHLGMHGQPFADDDLLLVAAGQVADRCFQPGVLDLQRSRYWSKIAISAPSETKGPAVRSSDLRQGHVVPAIHAQHEPLFLAVFRHQRNALPDRVGRRGNRHLLAFQTGSAPGRRSRRPNRVSAISVRPAPTRP